MDMRADGGRALSKETACPMRTSLASTYEASRMVMTRSNADSATFGNRDRMTVPIELGK